MTMSFGNTLTKRGGISLLFLCLCISISGPVQTQDVTDPATSATIPATSPVGPATSSPAASSVVPTGATQDPTATTAGKTADTKPTLDSPTTLPQPGLTPPVTGGATVTMPTTSAGTSLNSTNTSPVPAGPGGFTAPLQDGNGKKIVFPITDTNGRVIFQSATDMHISGISTKTPAGSSDSKGDKNAKNGSKPNSGNLLTSLPKSIIASLSLGVVVIILA
ncbi:hypothetical protein PGT21_015131 [Puccinia graminis f. sp. tritici]|uniref:Uncharacterized protein n=1 Tax=Puccinia graminis f. sp. tritici TaxID=56615 RepID=A0A5B0QW80_PUCGR|nr:hypothetical protein PGT21_015131 [Puccinia graminis f. sp. tritici]